MPPGKLSTRWPAFWDLGFPGGPALERAAATGNPKAHKFPRSFMNEQRLDFSFSGLKTAVLYAVKGKDLSIPHRPLTHQEKADAAASFQQAVVDVLVSKAAQSLAITGLRRLAVGGGVTANGALRRGLETMAKARGVELFIPPPNLCTDNAAMAAMAVEHWRLGQLRRSIWMRRLRSCHHNSVCISNSGRSIPLESCLFVQCNELAIFGNPFPSSTARIVRVTLLVASINFRHVGIPALLSFLRLSGCIYSRGSTAGEPE